MIKYLRQSFSGRQKSREVGRRQESDQHGTLLKNEKHSLNLAVHLLDGECQTFKVDRKAIGADAMDRVCFNLELVEIDFFGLQFKDRESVWHWIDLAKELKKQLKLSKTQEEGGERIYFLQFRVKFFPSQPQTVREELTKYYFYWQLKQDVASGSLLAPEDVAVQLAALTLQSELGDYDPSEHDAITVSEFRFVPERLQTVEMEGQVLLEWSFLRGLNPAQCENRYIEKAKQLEMYGVSMHEVLGKDGNLYKLGLTPFGMLIFDGEDRIGLFLWRNMTRLHFDRRQLFIHVAEPEQEQSDPREKLHVFQFTLQSSKVCKHVWKCAVEFHVFYRLHSANDSVGEKGWSEGGSVFGGKQKHRQSLVRMQSKFRFSGRTEAQLRQSARVPQARPRRQIQFQRKHSKRYSRRESHRIRETIQSQSLSQNQSFSSSAGNISSQRHNRSNDSSSAISQNQGRRNRSAEKRSVSQTSLNAARPSQSNINHNESHQSSSRSGDQYSDRDHMGYQTATDLIDFSPSSTSQESRTRSHKTVNSSDDKNRCMVNEIGLSFSSASGDSNDRSADSFNLDHRNWTHISSQLRNVSEASTRGEVLVAPPPRGISHQRVMNHQSNRHVDQPNSRQNNANHDLSHTRNGPIHVNPRESYESNVNHSYNPYKNQSPEQKVASSQVYTERARQSNNPDFLSSTMIDPQGTLTERQRLVNSAKVSRRVMMTEI